LLPSSEQNQHFAKVVLNPIDNTTQYTSGIGLPFGNAYVGVDMLMSVWILRYAATAIPKQRNPHPRQQPLLPQRVPEVIVSSAAWLLKARS
jgi:hypothetical protein